MAEPELIKMMKIRGATKEELDRANQFFNLFYQLSSLEIDDLY